MKIVAEVERVESTEKLSIPSNEMAEMPSDKLVEHKPESVGEAVVIGGLSVGFMWGFVLIGILLCFTGIGIIIGLPMILIGLMGMFVGTKETIKDSVELTINKK